MDRRMINERRPLAAGSTHPGSRGPGRRQDAERAAWRPDIAACVAIGGLVLGVLVLIPLLRAISPAPPSVFAEAQQSQSEPSIPTPVRSTYRIGSSVVAKGVAYSPLSVQQATSLDLPGPGGSSTVNGNFVIVKLLVRGVSATPSTASVGLVDLIDDGVDYRPLLPVATALSHTRWQTLVLRQLTTGESKRVKLIFEVPTSTQNDLKLLVGSHKTGAPRITVPVGPVT